MAFSSNRYEQAFLNKYIEDYEAEYGTAMPFDISCGTSSSSLLRDLDSLDTIHFSSDDEPDHEDYWFSSDKIKAKLLVNLN